MSNTKSITIELTFTEDNLNTMLRYANFGDGAALTMDDIIAQGRFDELKNELQNSSDNFVEEIVDGSEEACANDWLSEFGPEEDEDEDEDEDE